MKSTDTGRAARTPDVRGVSTVDVALWGRLWATLFAARYDRQVESGVTASVGSALAAHRARLASRRERADMAEALTLLIRDAGLGTRDGSTSVRVPIRADAVLESADVIFDVSARLMGPLPVRVRGMARLRILLCDGRGPVYRCGSGSFAAAMRGVLAAL